MMLAGDVLAFAMAPIDIREQVSTAGLRLISQAVPLILLALVRPWRLLLTTTPPVQSGGDGNVEYSAPTMSNGSKTRSDSSSSRKTSTAQLLP